MFNWSAFTLFLYMVMRMSGFVMFNPFFGRNGIPAMFQAGFIGLMSVSTYYMYDGAIAMPVLWWSSWCIWCWSWGWDFWYL